MSCPLIHLVKKERIKEWRTIISSSTIYQFIISQSTISFISHFGTRRVSTSTDILCLKSDLGEDGKWMRWLVNGSTLSHLTIHHHHFLSLSQTNPSSSNPILLSYWVTISHSSITNCIFPLDWIWNKNLIFFDMISMRW